MSISAVKIVNIGLVRAGIRQPIDSLTSPSQEAIAANLLYEPLRDTVLQEVAWPFATKRVALSQTGTPPTEWLYSYAYPDDCLQARAIEDGFRGRSADNRTAYSIEMGSAGRVIFTDKKDAVLVYTSQVTDPAVYPPMFVDALAWRLASEFMLSVVVDLAKASELRKYYELSINRAFARSQNEQILDPPPASDFLAARDAPYTLPGEPNTAFPSGFTI